MLDLIATTLSNPVNDLEGNIRTLEGSDDLERHIDRHVLDIDEKAPLLEACLAAIELAQKWIDQARTLRSETRLISHPYVIVDDSWIAQEPEAPAPHVYICISRDTAHFSPAEPSHAVAHSSFGNRQLDDALLAEGRRLLRPSENWDSGSWIITLPDARV